MSNNTGDFEDAIASDDKAVAIKPDFHDVWNNPRKKGNIYFYRGQREANLELL